MNTEAHVNEALQSLYGALAEVEQKRETIVNSIEALTHDFKSAAPLSGANGELPKLTKYPAVRTRAERFLSKYPVKPDGKLDIILKHLDVDFSGAYKTAERIERIAQAARRASKSLHYQEVAEYLMLHNVPYAAIARNPYAIRQSMTRRPHLYKFIGGGVFDYCPPEVSDAA